MSASGGKRRGALQRGPRVAGGTESREQGARRGHEAANGNGKNVSRFSTSYGLNAYYSKVAVTPGLRGAPGRGSPVGWAPKAVLTGHRTGKLEKRGFDNGLSEGGTLFSFARIGHREVTP